MHNTPSKNNPLKTLLIHKTPNNNISKTSIKEEKTKEKWPILNLNYKTSKIKSINSSPNNPF